MIRRIILALTLTAVAAPALAQPPAPPMAVAVTPGPVIQGVPVQQTYPQDFGGRGRRNRGDGQGFGGPGGGRGFNRFGGGPAAPPDPNPPAAAPTPPSPALTAQGRGSPVVAPLPADVLVTRSLQGSISAVFNPGAKTASIKLIETDDHGVEGERILKPGEVYRDGWRLGAVTATEATLRKGKAILHVDFTRGWPARAPIQPAVLVQPIAPPLAPNGRGGFGAAGGPRGPAPAAARGPASAANPALGLSNARTGGSPPAPPPPRPGLNMTIQGPNGPITMVTNPDGSRTMTTQINGQPMVVNMPAPQ